MKFTLGILFGVCFLSIPVTAQNLLPDGSFESINNANCISPEQGFADPIEWYDIQGNPDLFSNNCGFSGSEEIFWSQNSTAYDGSNFIGLRCRVNSNQSYQSEGIATPLLQSLESGKAYFITAQMKNKGIYQGFPASVISCPLKPEKKIEIYVHDAQIVITNDFSNGSAVCNGDLVTSIRSPQIQSDEVSDDWFTAGACFIAPNNASQLAIIMPLGNFGKFPECAADDTKGTFFSYYMEIDDLIVDEIPKEINITKYFDGGEDFEIYLPEEIDLSYIADAIYRWADGYEGSRRKLDVAGTYGIDLTLACGVIPIKLELIPIIEEFPFFIPNVFSPNEDGINDNFEIFIPEEKEIISYELEIFDRWGNKVFTSEQADRFWDGRILNKKANGQFLYHLSCTLRDEKGTQNYKKTATVTTIK